MSTAELAVELTQRLVELYQPDRIYLFGSRARGEAGPDSDFDFLVVVPDTMPRADWYPKKIFRLLADVDAPVDVVVWPRRRFEERLHLKASLPATVVREGTLLYAA